MRLALNPKTVAYTGFCHDVVAGASWFAAGPPHEGFLAVLRHLRRALRGYTVWVDVDRAVWHRGNEVSTFLAAHRDVHLEYLPTYQSGLNPEERT